MASSIIEFLRFATARGSRPHPDNIAEALDTRAGRQPIAVAVIRPNVVDICRAVPNRSRWRLDSHTSLQGAISEENEGISAEVIAALKERSPQRRAVIGIAAKVTAKMVPYNADVIGHLREHPGVHREDTDRLVWLWQEAGEKMLRYALPTAAVKSIEQVLEAEGIKLLRLDFLPQVLMNAMLAYGGERAPDTRRVLLILDDSLVQTLSMLPDGRWRDFRAMPIFNAKADMPVATLRDFLKTALRGDRPADLIVLDTHTAPEAAETLAAALREIEQEAKEPAEGIQVIRPPIKINSLNSGIHLDAHAIVLHP